MRRISRSEFTEAFPVVVPSWSIHGIETEPIRLERDAVVSGILKNDLVVGPGVKAIINGIIEGSLLVDTGAVAHITGIVKGNVDVRGAACIHGNVGSLKTADDAVLCLDNVLCASD